MSWHPHLAPGSCDKCIFLSRFPHPITQLDADLSLEKPDSWCLAAGLLPMPKAKGKWGKYSSSSSLLKPAAKTCLQDVHGAGLGASASRVPQQDTACVVAGARSTVPCDTVMFSLLTDNSSAVLSCVLTSFISSVVDLMEG